MNRMILLLALNVAACGATQASSPAPQSSTPASSESSSASAPAAWSDDMSKADKGAFMKLKVVPRLGAVFHAADENRYASFGCVTCHGPKFQLPKDFLPKLTMKAGKITAFAEKPQIAQFMAQKVAPEMAVVLGKPPFDPATGKGFGCMGCHAIESK
jgi:hypothetical protein